MTIDIRGVFRDAWSMWRRDRGVLLAVAGFFLFLPELARLVFVPTRLTVAVATPKQGQVPTLNDELQAMAQLFSQHALLLVAADVVMMFGVLVLFTLYLDGARRDVGGALLAALRRLPAFFVLSLTVELVATPAIFLIFLLVPALYLLGRLILSGPIFVAGPRVGPFAAIARSFRATRGRGIVLAGFATVILFAGVVLAAPALALGEVLDRAPLANPVSGLIIDAVAATLATIGTLGGTLIRVALYRRIGTSNGT